MRPKVNNFTIGEYYDPADEGSPAKRFARMTYFNVICRMRPETIHSLASCYNATDVIPHMQMFNSWDFLHAQINIRASCGLSGYQPPYSLDQLTKLRDDIVAWSTANNLRDLEDWVLDIALGQFEQWLWQPKIPHTQIIISNLEAVPYGYWWSTGYPRFNAYRDARFSFGLISFADWEQGQQEKHGPNSGIKMGWDEIPFDRLTYNNLQETRKHAKERICKAFEKALDAHLDEIDQEADKRGYVEAKGLERRHTHRHVTEPYEWLYHRHFGKLTEEKVAEMYGVDRGKSLSTAAVSSQTGPLAKLIGLEL